MENVLDVYSTNLAKTVRESGLPTMELDLDTPVRASSPDERLLEYIVSMLIRRNHLIFISDPVDKSEIYVNTLSLAFQNPPNYFNSIFERWVNSGNGLEEKKDAYFQGYYERFGRYEILQIDIERICTEAVDNPGIWDDLMNAVERYKDQYTFALKNLSSFYNTVSKEEAYFHKFNAFWSPLDRKPVFFISIDWANYNKYIEGGRLRIDMRRGTIPIPLTPRPLYLHKYSTGAIEPNNRFKFD